MGFMRHHAIIVTGDINPVKGARNEAIKIFENIDDWINGESIISEIMGPAINHYYTFFIGPDGSKEGWYSSDVFDEARYKFVKYLRSQQLIDWVEVQYGSDDGVVTVIYHSD